LSNNSPEEKNIVQRKKKKKMIYKLIYVLAVVLPITVAQNASICDEEELNAFIPNVRDCNAWFRCGPHGPEPGNCPSQFNFNPITRACDWPENVQCFSCPSNETLSTHIMNRSCRSFIRCIGGVASQLMCEPGLQFNNKTGQCDLQSVVQCTLRFQCPVTLPIDGSVIAIRDPYNCSVYHICVGDPEPVRKECNPELHFDPITSLCTFPNLTDCTPNTEHPPPEIPGEPEFRCAVDGTHPHPSNCATYFICANGNAQEFSCSPGLHFNNRTGQCDFPDVANCERDNFKKL
ncbi:putative chitinase 10, partial [Pseudolycoriella hygida]